MCEREKEYVILIKSHANRKTSIRSGASRNEGNTRLGGVLRDARRLLLTGNLQRPAVKDIRGSCSNLLRTQSVCRKGPELLSDTPNSLQVR